MNRWLKADLGEHGEIRIRLSKSLGQASFAVSCCHILLGFGEFNLVLCRDGQAFLSIWSRSTSQLAARNGERFAAGTQGIAASVGPARKDWLFCSNTSSEERRSSTEGPGRQPSFNLSHVQGKPCAGFPSPCRRLAGLPAAGSFVHCAEVKGVCSVCQGYL